MPLAVSLKESKRKVVTRARCEGRSCLWPIQIPSGHIWQLSLSAHFFLEWGIPSLWRSVRRGNPLLNWKNDGTKGWMEFFPWYTVVAKCSWKWVSSYFFIFYWGMENQTVFHGNVFAKRAPSLLYNQLSYLPIQEYKNFKHKLSPMEERWRWSAFTEACQFVKGPGPRPVGSILKHVPVTCIWYSIKIYIRECLFAGNEFLGILSVVKNVRK